MIKSKTLILSVALIVGGCLGMLVGCGSTRTITIAQVHTETDIQTVTVPHIVTKTVTKTVTAPVAHIPVNSGSGVQSFSGNGGKNLGTIRVEKESNIEWTDDGGYFSMYTSSGIPVNSQAHSGTSVLEAGNYSGVQINALGNWTIKIVPK
jgi:hypothetical protein